MYTYAVSASSHVYGMCMCMHTQVLDEYLLEGLYPGTLSMAGEVGAHELIACE